MDSSEDSVQNASRLEVLDGRKEGAMRVWVSELITRAFLDGVYHNEPQLRQASNSL